MNRHPPGFPSRLPHLAAVGDQWPILATTDTYPQGLRAFVDGLLTQATSDVGAGRVQESR